MIKAPERFDVVLVCGAIVNFEQIFCVFLMFLSQILKMEFLNQIKTSTGKIAFFDNFSCKNSSMQNKLTEVAMKITSPDFLDNDNHF